MTKTGKKIPAELHILTEGVHGFGLGLLNNHVASWTSSLNLCLNWLNQEKNQIGEPETVNIAPLFSSHISMCFINSLYINYINDVF